MSVKRKGTPKLEGPSTPFAGEVWVSQWVDGDGDVSQATWTGEDAEQDAANSALDNDGTRYIAVYKLDKIYKVEKSAAYQKTEVE